MTNYGPAEFQEELNVSRETMARLESYAGLLEKWSRAINLVSQASRRDLWCRHMLDSAQLLALFPPPPAGRPRTLLDLGSGAGFPGLVLAILGAGEVHLVEADAKKAAFLGEAARVTKSAVEIHNTRIEDLPAIRADVLTARALAPLPRLLDLVEPFLQGPETGETNEQANNRANTGGPTAIFPRGRHADRELTDSAEKWMMQAEVIASRSDPESQIIRLHGLARKGRRP